MKKFNKLYDKVLDEQKNTDIDQMAQETIDLLLDYGVIDQKDIEKIRKEFLTKAKAKLNESKKNGKSAAYDIKRELILMAAKNFKISSKETKELLAHLERTTK